MSAQATTMGGGMCQGKPDICKTPSPNPTGWAPVAYVNMASPSNVMNGTSSLKVKIDGQAACHVGSIIQNSTGDEAGSMGGLLSQVNLGAAKWLLGSVTVQWEGQPAVSALSPLTQNGAPPAGTPPNCAGKQEIPSQVKVTIGM